MNNIDRILLALLILLLPLGLLVSNKLISSSGADEVVIDAKKLKEVVDDYSQMRTTKKPKGEIVISSVTYATESGVVSVSGDAPSSQTSILMSVTVLPPDPSPTPKSSKKTEDNKLVLGRSVDLYSFDTKSDGTFDIDYEIDENVSVIEFRFEQDETVKTLRFDLEKKKQIY